MPSFCGMFRYSPVTSIVTSNASLGTFSFSIVFMKSFVSLMYEGISTRDFLSTRSTTLEILSVGPEQPETIGLMPIGVLCIFLRKYILCVLTLSSSNFR